MSPILVAIILLSLVTLPLLRVTLGVAAQSTIVSAAESVIVQATTVIAVNVPLLATEPVTIIESQALNQAVTKPLALSVIVLEAATNAIVVAVIVTSVTRLVATPASVTLTSLCVASTFCLTMSLSLAGSVLKYDAMPRG